MNKCILFCAIVSISIAGCTAKKQVPKTSLYEANISTDVPYVTEKSYLKTIDIGPDGKQVPVQIAWRVILDTTGCLKISHVNVSRQGGDPETFVSEVKHITIPECGMKWESQDPTRYQTAIIQLNYESRKLIKTESFSGGVAMILGNGELIPM